MGPVDGGMALDSARGLGRPGAWYWIQHGAWGGRGRGTGFSTGPGEGGVTLDSAHVQWTVRP